MGQAIKRRVSIRTRILLVVIAFVLFHPEAPVHVDKVVAKETPALAQKIEQPQPQETTVKPVEAQVVNEPEPTPQQPAPQPAPVVQPTPPAPAPAPVSGSKYDWMAQAGIPETYWTQVDWIVTRESGWRVNAQNLSSGAYGLPQSLPGSKMASAGADWQTNPVTQLRWMNNYVTTRYGGWQGAINFWQVHHWY